MYTRRRNSVQLYIESNGEATLEELHSMFPELSVMTLRRDLIALETAGVVRRTQGGAVALKRTLQSESNSEKTRSNLYIANLAVSLLQPHRSTYLDAGGISLCLARMLPNQPFSFVTGAPDVALELLRQPQCDVTLLGGQLQRDSMCSAGGSALSQLESLNIDTALLTAQGFSFESGFCCTPASQNELNRFICKRARRIIVLLDVDNLERTLPLSFADLSGTDALIMSGFPGEQLATACVRNAVDLVF